MRAGSRPRTGSRKQRSKTGKYENHPSRSVRTPQPHTSDPNYHRHRHRGLGREHARRQTAIGPCGHRRIRRLPDRQRPAPDRAPLAGHVPFLVLPWRCAQHVGHRRHRCRALGHRGQALRRPQLHAHGRQRQRPDPRLRPLGHPRPFRRRTGEVPRATHDAPEDGLHRVQGGSGRDLAGARAAIAHRRVREGRPMSHTAAGLQN